MTCAAVPVMAVSLNPDNMQYAKYRIESHRRLSPHVTAPLLIQKLRCLLEPDCMLSRSMGRDLK